MADKEISDLSAATVLNDADLLVVEQGGVTKKIVGSVLKDADKVDGFHAGSSASSGILLALNSSSKLPASITGDADTVNGKHASPTPAAGTIPVSGGDGKLAADWISIASLPKASAFYSHLNDVNQTGVVTETATQVNFLDTGALSYDIESCFSSHRYQPTVEGYYLIIAQVCWVSTVSGKIYSASINRNADGIASNTVMGQAVATKAYNTMSALVYMNGTSHWIEVLVYHDQGSNADINGYHSETFLTGVRVA
jgi:hypothetical protein